MQHEIDSESDSETDAMGYTLIPRVKIEVSRLEIPDSIQQIVSKIEQAQLLRTREVGIFHENFIGCNLIFL